MSATHRTVRVSFIVADYDHVPDEIRREANRRGCSVDDLVTRWMERVISDAATRYLQDHPELFAAGSGIV